MGLCPQSPSFLPAPARQSGAEDHPRTTVRTTSKVSALSSAGERTFSNPLSDHGVREDIINEVCTAVCEAVKGEQADLLHFLEEWRTQLSHQTHSLAVSNDNILSRLLDLEVCREQASSPQDSPRESEEEVVRHAPMATSATTEALNNPPPQFVLLGARALGLAQEGLATDLGGMTLSEAVILIFVAAAIIFIGVDAQIGLQSALESWEEDSRWMDFLAMAFSAELALELCIRLRWEQRNFFLGDNGCWNLLDGVVLLAEVANGVLQLGVPYIGWCLRVVRAARIFRLLRRKFVLLRLLMQAVKVSFKFLLWTALLMTLLVYIQAVVVVFLLTSAAKDETLTDDSRDYLLENYGNLGQAIATLVMLSAGVLPWEENVAALNQASGSAAGFAMSLFAYSQQILIFSSLAGILDYMTSFNNRRRQRSFQEEMWKQGSPMNLLKKFLKKSATPRSSMVAAHTITERHLREILGKGEGKELVRRNDLTLDVIISVHALLDIDDTTGVLIEDLVNALAFYELQPNTLHSLYESRRLCRRVSEMWKMLECALKVHR